MVNSHFVVTLLSRESIFVVTLRETNPAGPVLVFFRISGTSGLSVPSGISGSAPPEKDLIASPRPRRYKPCRRAESTPCRL